MGVGMMRGRRVRVAGVGLALTLAGVGWGQVTQVVEPPAPLLPFHAGLLVSMHTKNAGHASDADGQTFEGESCLPKPLDDPAKVRPADGGARCAAIFKEAGLTRYEAGSYARAVGSGKAVVAALEFGDATGAYSAYTFFRSQMHGVSTLERGRTDETATAGDATLVWAETAVLSIQGKVTSSELSAFVTGLPKVSGRRALAPLLPTLLPQEGLERGSLRYALGPASYTAMGGQLPGVNDLGWDKSLEVATATYDLHGKTGTLTLLMYPTPQIAGDRGRALAAAINAEGEAKLGTVKMHRVGPMVGVTTGDWTPAAADAEVHGLRLNQELSFDKKMPLEFHAEVTKTFSLLQNIAVLSGVLGLAAVLLGLFLGGARAGIRVLRGKPAASEPEFLTINLRGGPGTGLGDGGEKGA